VDSLYFGGEGGEDDVLSGEDLTSYIYTDRPIYRPAQKVYFKGILRQWGRDGYQLLDSKSVNLTVEDPNNGKIFEKELPLTSRGELSVDFEVPAPDPKEEWDYSYRLEAQVTDASRREMQGAASFIGTRGKTVADAYPERYLYYQGDSAKVRVKTADYAGHPV